MKTSQDIALTILKQLGGRRFIAMVGATNLLAGKASLSFRVGKGARDGISHVEVKLLPSDLYRVVFSSVHKGGLDVRTVAVSHGVYAEDLRPVFEKTTGFYTSL